MDDNAVTRFGEWKQKQPDQTSAGTAGVVIDLEETEKDGLRAHIIDIGP